MIIDADENALPHLFLIGFRAPPGGPIDVDTDRLAERVGIFVAQNVILFDGNPRESEKVRTKDVPYENLPATGPFRYESEIAPWKPEPDVIVVDDLENFLAPAQIADVDNLATHITGANFGTVRVIRASAAPIPNTARNYGWRPRTQGTRLGEAGRNTPPDDASSLQKFDPDKFDLPDKFDNAFHNGGALSGANPFEPSDQLIFTDTANHETTLTIPPGPELEVSEKGKLLVPPLTLTPRVDTVVMDISADEFTLVWRATFPWESRFETATLGVH